MKTVEQVYLVWEMNNAINSLEYIFTQEELMNLFPNQPGQKIIFMRGMNRLIKIISERTVHTPFVMLETEVLE